MGFNYFSRYHFIGKAPLVNGSDFRVSECYSFLLEGTNQEDVDTLFLLAYPEMKLGKFSVVINPTGSFVLNEGWLKKLYFILAHPEYFRISDKVIIGFIGAVRPNYHETAFFKMLSEQLMMQGFQFQILNLSAGDNRLPSYIRYFSTSGIGTGGFTDWYLEQLLVAERQLEIYVDCEPEERLTLNSLRAKVETELAEKTVQLNEIISQRMGFSLVKQELQDEMKRVKEELITKTEYLDFVTGKGTDGTFNPSDKVLETMKIKRFYHEEYEVLPLWYKRFGHIIKVIMGKRKFRSLFNDRSSKK